MSRGHQSVDDQASVGLFTNTIKLITSFESDTFVFLIPSNLVTCGSELRRETRLMLATEETLSGDLVELECKVLWIEDFNIAAEFHGDRDFNEDSPARQSSDF